jgi:hypothetical protein
LELLFARYMLEQGDGEGALAIAEQAYQLADQLGYRGLCAHAAATMIGCLRSPHEAAAAERWALVALSDFSKTQDHLLGYDLFNVPGIARGEGGPLSFSNDLLSVIFERIVIIIPQLMSDAPDQLSEVRVLVADLLRYAGTPSLGVTSLDRSTGRVNASNSAFAHYLAKTATILESTLALDVSVLLPHSQRQLFKERLAGAMLHLVSQIRPGAKRLFLVG